MKFNALVQFLKQINPVSHDRQHCILKRVSLKSISNGKSISTTSLKMQILLSVFSVHHSSAECYNVLSPFFFFFFFTKNEYYIPLESESNVLSIVHSSLDVACYVSMGMHLQYKLSLFNLASMTKNDYKAELFYVHLNQRNESIKRFSLVHEHIHLCHWFIITMHQLSEDEERDSGAKESTSIYIIKESSSHPR